MTIWDWKNHRSFDVPLGRPQLYKNRSMERLGLKRRALWDEIEAGPENYGCGSGELWMRVRRIFGVGPENLNSSREAGPENVIFFHVL